ncbi:hypothetical protein HYH03_008550 [Edaphochlamys debaryana]|uniref:Protein kinase domain-containing protein n=1 Tax=Edaphochlamys debaryana TaxID=47281 RepID=A0A836BZ79_9CHLO|nr:hypothetical protein HYH03_008550 [Edaphochlamys debaryana]|eukprot:KAG2493123.1 hypothetical protein HYH03_008550 [Edaphochlamys debaryana]
MHPPLPFIVRPLLHPPCNPPPLSTLPPNLNPKVQLGTGSELRLQRLALADFRRGRDPVFAPGFDLLLPAAAAAPGAETGVETSAGARAGARVGDGGGQPPPLRGGGVAAAPPLRGTARATPTPTLVLQQAAVVLDMALEAMVPAEPHETAAWGARARANYHVALLNVSVLCQRVVDEACLAALGPYGCVTAALAGGAAGLPPLLAEARQAPSAADADGRESLAGPAASHAPAAGPGAGAEGPSQPPANGEDASVSSGHGGGGAPALVVVGAALGGAAALVMVVVLATAALLLTTRLRASRRKRRGHRPPPPTASPSCVGGAKGVGSEPSSAPAEEDAEARAYAPHSADDEAAGAAGSSPSESLGRSAAASTVYGRFSRPSDGILLAPAAAGAAAARGLGAGGGAGAGPSSVSGCSPPVSSRTGATCRSGAEAAVLTGLTPFRADVRRGDRLQLDESAVAGGPNDSSASTATGPPSSSQQSGAGSGGGSAGNDEVVRLLPEVLGKGGFGRVRRGVYRGRAVAVKQLDMGAHDPLAATPSARLLVNAFRQELEVLARCEHPCVVRLLAACVKPPAPFVVLELLDTSLDKVLYGMYGNPGGLLPLPLVLHIGLQVAKGLEYLHPTVLHRDLKPANVLISDPWGPSPVVKIADFGLSRLRETVLHTLTPEAGTPPYTAPECFDLSNFFVTHKADVYSLGVLLWEMLAGTQPWRGMGMVEVASQVTFLGRRLPLPPHLPPGCPGALPGRWPRGLVRLIRQCWEGDPQRRPAAAEAVKWLALEQELLGRQQAQQAQHGLQAQQALEAREALKAHEAQGAPEVEQEPLRR